MNWNKCVIVNSAWQGWYDRGQIRLRQSIIDNGYQGNTLFFNNVMPNAIFKPEYPYTIKTSSLDEAVRLGYENILWLDCSIWLNKDITPIFEKIENEGGLFIESGYNMAQTSSDMDLLWAGINRDEAEKMNECWSCIFGFNINSEKGKIFWEYMKDGTNYGVCNTSRLHSNQSKDERFLFARQDQTLVSFSLIKAGFNLSENNLINKENSIFGMQGM